MEPKEILLQLVQNSKEHTRLLEALHQAHLQSEVIPSPKPIELPTPRPEPIKKELNPLPKDTAYGKPLVITKGGTYSGNWQSSDSEIPAVDIRTKEPVIIENANIKGAGYLIKCWYQDCDLIVRNTRGFGLAPTAWKEYRKPRRFVTVNYFKNVVIENCDFESTAGIYIGDKYVGNGTPQNTVLIRYNKVKNIDGRVLNSWERSQFVQYNFRGELPHSVIAWNEVINEPNKSLVEDNINLYSSRGTKASPILIHDNYLQGAFPIPANTQQYSGGGIIMDSALPLDPKNTATAYVKVFNNQTVGMRNYNYQIASGHDIEFYNNRGVSASTPDTAGHRVGMQGEDYYKKGVSFNNVMRDNYTNVAGTVRNYFPDKTVTVANNTEMLNKATQADEQAERLAWEVKVKLHNITLGVK